jgi:hypothetical protein
MTITSRSPHDLIGEWQPGPYRSRPAREIFRAEISALRRDVTCKYLWL